MNIKKLSVVFFSTLLLFLSEGKAQILQDVAGKVITTLKYEEIHGTPYLSDDWCIGTVKLNNGQTYNLPIKYNLYTDSLYFKGKNEETLAFVQPVNEFVIIYSKDSKDFKEHFKNGFKTSNGTSVTTFFEVLAEGTVQLLKKSSKTILENKQYSSATIDKSFENVTKYYIVKNGDLILIKKDKKAILAVLGDKQASMDAYIKSNSINVKDDADLAKLITYYNSI